MKLKKIKKKKKDPIKYVYNEIEKQMIELNNLGEEKRTKENL